MNPIESISSVFRNYVNFSGRAQRSEFWWFTLFSFVLQAILNFAPVIGWIFSLAVLLPSLAVTARRLHDTGRSARWLLIYAVIVVGWIIVLILGFALLIRAAVDESSIQERLYSEVGVAVSEDEIPLIREACNEPDDWELSESEQEEKEAICDIVVGSWTDVLGVLMFLVIWILVSAAGVITILVLCAMPGTRGPNRYGPDPLEPPSGAGGGYGYTSPGAPYTPSPPFNPAASNAPSGTEAARRQFCTQCGARLEPDARFCAVCNTPVT